MKEKKRLLNGDITAKVVQIITDDGNLGEISIDEARQRASRAGLDLMQIGETGNVAIVKMLDYGKFLYKQKKQDQQNKLKTKSPELKTIRITFKIGDHDLLIKKAQAEKFHKDGDNVKVSMLLKGRENQYQGIAREKLENFIKSLEEIYKMEKPITKSGNDLSTMLKPIK